MYLLFDQMFYAYITCVLLFGQMLSVRMVCVCNVRLSVECPCDLCLCC